MVAPCKEGEDFQQLIYKEYLTYQLYQHLTDFSFRTQLVKVTLKDDNSSQPPIEVDGFLIEEDEAVASRMTASVMPEHEKLKFIDQNCYRLFTMFQYAIGNTDWNLSKRHNIKLIKKNDSKTPIPVPYDFDYCGLVNAPYAIPHPQLPIKNVRERHFMWRGKDKKGFEDVVALFDKKKASLLSLVEKFPHLKKKEKEDVLKYIEGFYKKLESENVVALN